MEQIHDLLAVARGEHHTKESPPGSNNVKYNTEYYTRPVSGADYPWCMVFVWWCFFVAGLSHLFYGGKKTASCVTLLDYAKKNGQFVEPRDLQQGDVVFFRFATNSRAANHVGIVQFAFETKLVTHEGNTSLTSEDNGGAVMERTRDYTHVVGGYRPNYEEDEMTQEKFEAMFAIMMAKRGELLPQYTSTVAEEYAAAIAAGVTDGTRPQAFTTREESALMAMRAAQGKCKCGNG